MEYRLGKNKLLIISMLLLTCVSLVSAQSTDISQSEIRKPSIFETIFQPFSVTAQDSFTEVNPGETASFTINARLTQDVYLEGKQKKVELYQCEGMECTSKNMINSKYDSVIWGVSESEGTIFAWDTTVSFPSERGYYTVEGYLYDDRDNEKLSRTDVIPVRVGSDSDGDGVFDVNDDCPDLQGSLANNGCPDSDGDGFLDKNDECPETGDQGLGLDSSGCPLNDADGDGVLDRNDECSEVAGSKANGCPTLWESIQNQLTSIFQLFSP